MSSLRRASRLARRRQARFDRDRACIGRHYHQTAFLPEPWGAFELPVTFSRGHYEQQSAWFSQAVGGASFMGGPVWAPGHGAPGCGCPAGRTPGRRAQGLPYWQVLVDSSIATEIAERSRVGLLRHTASSGAHTALHPEDDFLGPINCRSSLHEEIERRVGDVAEAQDRAARAEGRRWPDVTDPDERVRWLWRFGHETAIELGFSMPPLPPDGLDVRTVRRRARTATAAV